MSRSVTHILLRSFLMLAATSLMVVFYAWLYISVLGLDLPKAAMLKKRNAQWQSRSELLSRRLDACERALVGIEDRDNGVYRSIYGMGTIPSEIKAAKIDAELFDSLASVGATPGFLSMLARVSDITRRTYVQSKSLDEINLVARRAGDMISCVPAVPPILPRPESYRISSRFGYRVDPVRGGGEFHQGVDFAMQRGSPVYAVGDGVIEMAEIKFTGYGNEIVIDHGFGYKTRYAHLNTIEVAPGMKVSRGEKIGTVGNSGKSTGSHLHYEVMYRNGRVNPLNYMDLTIPEEEYRSMIDKRSEESVRGKRLSTSELLKKRDADERSGD